MVDFEGFEVLLKCLKIKNIPARHSSENNGWEISEYHLQICLVKIEICYAVC